MDRAYALSLKQFLHTFAKDDAARLLSYLPEGEEQELASFPDSVEFKPHSIDDELEKIHYTWFVPFLETFAKSDAHFLASALSDTKFLKIKRRLHFSEKKIPLTETGKRFAHQTLYHWLVKSKEGYTPKNLVPRHPLKELLALSKNELFLTFDYLGLHDLAVDLQKVVETKKIQALKKALSENQSKYIEDIVKHGEPIAFKRLELEFWDGDLDTLHTMVHTRGINRISKALYGCPPSLLWHIRHSLDTGRARLLDRFLVNPHNEKVQDILLNQVLKAVKHVQGGI